MVQEKKKRNEDMLVLRLISNYSYRKLAKTFGVSVYVAWKIVNRMIKNGEHVKVLDDVYKEK